MRLNACRSTLVCTVAAFVSLACGDHPSAPTIESRLSGATIVALFPTQLDTIVGSHVQIVVEVDDKTGKPLDSVKVEFTPPRGYLDRLTTGADGRASYDWAVPPTPGTYALVAMVPKGPSVSFAIHARHGPPFLLVPSTDSVLASDAGSTLYPMVAVHDAFGNPLSGVTLAFAVGGAAGAVLERASATTNDAGLAAPGGWTLGTSVGEYSLTAVVQEGDYPPSVTITARVNPTFGVTAIAAGQFSGCAIAASGAPGIYCWGQLLQTVTSGPDSIARLPTAVPNAPQLVALAVGYAHACGLTSDGTAYCWGDNSSGQAGGPVVPASPAAIHPVPGRIAFKQIVAGRHFTCGLALDGTAWCWGDGTLGELGNGTRAGSSAPSPVSGNLVFSSLAAGDQHVCGLSSANEVWCWGRGDAGQLGASAPAMCVASDEDYYYGDPVYAGCALAPVRATKPPPLTSISASSDTCGLGVDGNAVCWGPGRNGVTIYLAPAPFSGVVAAGQGVCALARSGEVYCANSPPLQRAGPAAPVGAITAGLAHQCAVARDTGIAYCWGANSQGQLGNGTTASSITAIALAAPPRSP